MTVETIGSAVRVVIRCAAQDLATASLPELTARSQTLAHGLSAAQAGERRDEPNEIAENRRHPLLEFAGYFWAPIPWVIEAALVPSLLVRHWTDAVIIGVLLVINGAVGVRGRSIRPPTPT